LYFIRFYTAVSKVASGDWRAQLALSTCETDCLTKANWKSHGPLFPDVFWCKSGSLLIHNDTHRYLFFNDSNIVIAQTKDLIHYDLTPTTLLMARPNNFDSALVEAGPEPIKLSDNNYLFLYNSARQANIANPKPGWTLEYNLGWTILNGDNPTEILARSDQPIFSPELDWEKCDNSSNEWANRGLTPLVIFVEGWKKTAENTFLVWYQGCDTTMGLAELRVYFSGASSTTPVLTSTTPVPGSTTPVLASTTPVPGSTAPVLGSTTPVLVYFLIFSRLGFSLFQKFM
jgi:predicted GH43/DUF377 family glycosyl hydrolase